MIVSVTVLDADFFSSLCVPFVAAAGGVPKTAGTTAPGPAAIHSFPCRSYPVATADVLELAIASNQAQNSARKEHVVIIIQQGRLAATPNGPDELGARFHFATNTGLTRLPGENRWALLREGQGSKSVAKSRARGR